MAKLRLTVKSLQALKPPADGRTEYWDESAGGSFGLGFPTLGNGRGSQCTGLGAVRDAPRSVIMNA